MDPDTSSSLDAPSEHDATVAPTPLEELQARADRLERELRELRGLLAEARATEGRPPSAGPEHEPAPEPARAELVDRRSLLRRGTAVAAAGAVASSAALAATATPAAAANGDPLTLGQSNTAANTTTLSGRLSLTSTSSTDTVRAINTGTGGSKAVFGWAQGTDGVGVHGLSTDGPGLVVGNGTQVIPPQAGNWPQGSFLVAGSHLFYCYSGGAGPASKWARLSGVFVPFDAAVRIYDSRPGTEPPTPPKTRFTNHEERTLSLTVNNAIPAGISPSAVVLNLTATNTNPGGYFTAWRSTIPWPGTSSVNWSSENQTIANQSTVKVNGLTQVKVRCEGEGGADLVVDVVGYYL